MTRSSVGVSAMPASSMTTTVFGPKPGSSPAARVRSSIASVSDRIPVASPSTAAAAAEGASPTGS